MNLYRGSNDSLKSKVEFRDNAIKRQKLISNDMKKELAENIVSLEKRLQWVHSFQSNPLPASLVKDYISYSRQYCFSKPTKAAAEVLQDYFLSLR